MTEPSEQDQTILWMRRLIWLYIGLLFFEGALRKWVIPQLATPLLIIRDPVVIAAYILAFRARRFPWNIYVTGMWGLGAAALVISCLFTIRNPSVAFYGFRATYLHLPFIFLVGSYFTYADVNRFCRFMLWLSIPMALLVAVQAGSPATALVNKGVGAEASAVFGGAPGYFRPPATFSFIAGTTNFFTMAAACVSIAVLHQKRLQVSSVLVIAAGVALVVAVIFSISRRLFISFGLIFIAAALVATVTPRNLPRLLVFFAIVLPLASLAFLLPEVQNAFNAFEYRWNTSTVDSGGFQHSIINRLWRTLTEPFMNLPEDPLLGVGLGVGTNAGAVMLKGSRMFLIGESEWGRQIGETGVFIGLLTIALRTALAGALFFRSLGALRQSNGLPMLLFVQAGLLLVIGVWAQPTILGFAILSAGLTLAAIQEPPTETPEPDSSLPLGSGSG